ncbi:hypothetical protein BT96DRAFT_950141 [Gymnopus androsaceus JB14]|uniref:Uncharacterized protein n=1 Tax=Gymnopus androsaceus JB14 TaxID=1447944 RepID=A0A6A4GHG3_9AGAR|nr:hypothetical protein BT96DRAFT_950141 [Gymnopus androsaceus JB14]
MVSLEPSLIQDSIVTLNANDLVKLCSIIKNNNKSFKSVRTDKVNAPMDFAVLLLAGRPCIKSIFPSAIDGDLLNLFISQTFSAWLKGMSIRSKPNEVDSPEQDIQVSTHHQRLGDKDNRHDLLMAGKDIAYC